MTIYNNRLFVAIPINGATENNAVLVYNFLNSAWEGMDQSPSTVASTSSVYAQSAFNITSFLYLQYLGKLHLFGLSNAGYIFLYDYDECDMTDTVSALYRYPATSTFISRGLTGTQADFYGQTVGAGTLHKFADQIAFHLQSSNPSYSVSVLTDRVNDLITYLSNKTYSNQQYSSYGTPNFNVSNTNNDFNNPNRNDYSVNLQRDGGLYLAPMAPASGGLQLQLRQSYSLPFKVEQSGSYFMLQFTNTGGNTIISNIEVSSLAKETSFDKSN